MTAPQPSRSGPGSRSVADPAMIDSTMTGSALTSSATAITHRPVRPPGRRLAGLVLVAALVAAGCSGEPSTGADDPSTTTAPRASSTTTAPTTTTTEPPVEAVAIGSYPVGSTEVALVDTSRDTVANGNAPATEGRKLPTVVFYPADGEPGSDPAKPEVTADAEARDGRYPLIVFSHGVTARGIFYQGELAAWASAGYVVVAPDYPLSNTDSPGGPSISDVGNQPGDASFLIDAFTDPEGDSPAAEVAAQVDADNIGAAGHSLGAVTSLGLGYSTCCADDRVDAVAAWAGVFLPMLDEKNPEKGITDRPLLLIHGDADGTVPYSASVTAFDVVESPRWFITLPGAGHIPPFLSPAGNPVATLVNTTTLDFFDAELKDDADGISRLEAEVEEIGAETATLQSAGS